MRVCYVHIGTHKTGTSSVQAMLSMNKALLAQAGIHVLSAARPVHLLSAEHIGNHNLAWELNGDTRFDPNSGALEDTLKELESAPERVAVISSEDFEYLGRDLRALERLRDALAAIDYQAKIIVYLRNRADYAISLYLTLLYFLFSDPFESYIEAILRDGACIYRNTWIFQFFYSRLLDAFSQSFGAENLIARVYDGERDPLDLIHDFIGVILAGAGSTVLDELAIPARLNERMRETEFRMRMRALGIEGASYPTMSAEQLARFGQRFSLENDELVRRYALALAPML